MTGRGPEARVVAWPAVAEGTRDGTDPATDEHLRALGIWRFPIPTPYSREAVNVYAIEDAEGGIALVDTGVNSRTATGALAEAFWRLGLGFTDVRRILVTHGHPDHFGSAQWIVERAGREVPVFAHPADLPKIDDSGPRWGVQLPQYEALLVRHGVPREAFLRFAYCEASAEDHARRVHRTQPLRDGQILRFRRFEATALHLPGHTPGVVCLFDAANGLFWSNDHVLEKVIPSVEIEPGTDGENPPFRPLAAYLDSLRFTRTLDVRTVLPGHGRPFHGHRAAIDEVVRVYSERQERVCDQLASGPKDAYAITQALFPRTASAQLLSALSQSVASLEVLEERGEVLREDDAGTWVYRRAR